MPEDPGWQCGSPAEEVYNPKGLRNSAAMTEEPFLLSAYYPAFFSSSWPLLRCMGQLHHRCLVWSETHAHSWREVLLRRNAISKHLQHPMQVRNCLKFKRHLCHHIISQASPIQWNHHGLLHKLPTLAFQIFWSWWLLSGHIFLQAASVVDSLTSAHPA